MSTVVLEVFKDGRRGGDHLDSLVGESGWYYDVRGKPWLKDGGFVSWAYSAGWTLFARGDVEVGVDMEILEELPYALEDYAFVLTEDERAYVVTSSDFLHVWTSKEAFVKLYGTGIVDRLHKMSVHQFEKAGLVYMNRLQVGSRIVAVCTRERVTIQLKVSD